MTRCPNLLFDSFVLLLFVPLGPGAGGRAAAVPSVCLSPRFAGSRLRAHRLVCPDALSAGTK